MFIIASWVIFDPFITNGRQAWLSVCLAERERGASFVDSFQLLIVLRMHAWPLVRKITNGQYMVVWGEFESTGLPTWRCLLSWMITDWKYIFNFYFKYKLFHPRSKLCVLWAGSDSSKWNKTLTLFNKNKNRNQESHTSAANLQSNTDISGMSPPD